MFYEILHGDGSKSHLRLVDGVCVETEISKWPDEMRANVKSWKQIDAWPEFEQAPALPKIDLSTMPDSVRDVLAHMANALETMQVQHVQNLAQVDALRAEKAELHDRLGRLEDTNAKVRNQLNV